MKTAGFFFSKRLVENSSYFFIDPVSSVYFNIFQHKKIISARLQVVNETVARSTVLNLGGES